MPFTLSQVMLDAMTAQGSNERPMELITLSHPSFPVPRRYVDDFVGTTSRGVPFDPFPFEVVFPDEMEDQAPVMTVVFDLVSRTQIDWARGFRVAPTALVEVVRESDPNYVEFAFPPVFTMTEVSSEDRTTLRAKLEVLDLTVQKHLRQGYTADNYPALSRAVG
jgi:hypothetical protein